MMMIIMKMMMMWKQWRKDKMLVWRRVHGLQSGPIDLQTTLPFDDVDDDVDNDHNADNDNDADDDNCENEDDAEE